MMDKSDATWRTLVGTEQSLKNSLPKIPSQQVPTRATGTKNPRVQPPAFTLLTGGLLVRIQPEEPVSLAAVGETEKALLWLDRTIDRGMINYPFLSEHDLYLNNIRGEARFDQAMKLARREWERFEV